MVPASFNCPMHFMLTQPRSLPHPLELAQYGIRVNAIAPGFIKTEMVASMKPEILAKMAATIPVQRLGEPAEIATTAAFIVENDYCNGRVIEIDGGQRL